MSAAPTPRRKDPMTRPVPQEWRCSACGTRLGIAHGQQWHLRYKTAQYIVAGPVVATCHRCSARNESPSLPASLEVEESIR